MVAFLPTLASLRHVRYVPHFPVSTYTGRINSSCRGSSCTQGFQASTPLLGSPLDGRSSSGVLVGSASGDFGRAIILLVPAFSVLLSCGHTSPSPSPPFARVVWLHTMIHLGQTIQLPLESPAGTRSRVLPSLSSILVGVRKVAYILSVVVGWLPPRGPCESTYAGSTPALVASKEKAK